MIELTKENILKTVKEHKIVLIDFWASWCGPCKMLTPILEEIQKDFKNEDVIIGKVNVEEQQELAMSFDIKSIPTLIMFKNNEIVDGFIGVVPKQFILERINNQL